MKFHSTRISDVWVIEPDVFEDERGSFERVFSRDELQAQGLELPVDEGAVSRNRLVGTLRGLHYQAAPRGQTKLVRCGRGAIHDVVVDLRPDSPTFKEWVGVDLSAVNRRALYVPQGFAHGFMTLEENSEVVYLMSGLSVPNAARGVPWNDPAFGIEWPMEPQLMSAQDRAWPRL
jgi:dTDP-4-dehydrorhamnose 3,5-epimerase